MGGYTIDNNNALETILRMIMDDTILPPHDIEAEKAVLGAIMLNGDLFWNASSMLRDEDFFLESHRVIWRAIFNIAVDGTESIDILTIRAYLDRIGSLESAGGSITLSRMIDGIPRYSNIDYYVKIIKDRSLLRQQMNLSLQMYTTAGKGPGKAHEIYGQYLERLLDLGIEKPGTKLLSNAEASRELQDILAAWSMSLGDDDSIIKCSWDGFDKHDLFRRGKLGIVAALPSLGKTMFLCNLAVDLATKEYNIFYFSKEDGGKELRQRMLSLFAGIPFREVMRRHREMDGDAYDIARNRFEDFRKLPIHIVTDISFDTDMLLAMARAQASQGCKPDMVLVDYLQLLPKTDNRNLELGDITRKLRQLASDLNCYVLVASQFSRQAAMTDVKGQHRRPSKSDIRDSGEIEQCADNIIMLHRENYFNAETRPNMGATEVIIDKNRQGATGMFYLFFDGAMQKVRPCSTDEYFKADVPELAKKGIQR